MKSLSRFVSLCLCGSFVLSAAPARAIELSLEENRAERGSVGYVDMQRLFKASPDATRAREGLEELVRQAEELVNAKKAEVLRLRQELATIKIEREELAKSTPTVTVPVVVSSAAAKAVEAPKPVPAANPAPVTALPPAALPHRGAIPLPATPAQTPETSTASAPSPAPLMINLPGLTDGPLNLERPGASPLNPTRAKKEPEPAPVVVAPAPAAVEIATASAVIVSTAASVDASTSAAPAPFAPTVPAGPTLTQRLLEFDGRIVAKQVELDRVQAELDRERLAAERTLLDAESRKTDQVLARLYRAVSEVAKREGVSVVVDKSATLYGNPAVDLTDKILKQLRGVVQVQ